MTLNSSEMAPSSHVPVALGNSQPIEAKIIPKKNVPSKVLLWEAIAQNGQTSPVFVM